MNILAMDTSCDILSLALSCSDNLWQVEINAGARHSELLMDWVNKLFLSAGIESCELDLAVCMKGPGSFTGLRIGYAAAKGLSLALGIPLAAIPTLDCIAAAHTVWPGIVLTVLDAKKSCFFAALYRKNIRLTPYMDEDPGTVLSMIDTYRLDGEPLLVTGNGAELFLSRINDKIPENDFSLDPLCSRGRSMEILKIIKESGIVNYVEDIHSGPFYLRKSDAEMGIHSSKTM